jgi:ABC-type lipoprotein export system ATPase subunit
MIHFKQVTKVYAGKGSSAVTAVRELSLSIKRGEFVVITGRSGSGKTTMLNLMAGLTRPTSGLVELDDMDLWSVPDREQSALRNRRMGFVFQFPSLLPSLTVLENVMLPAMFKPALESSHADARAGELLAMVGLSEKLDVFPRQLSAGQQQRVVIARSLINQPQILIADEPTSNLDAQSEKEIMAIFQEIHRIEGLTVIMVTHNCDLGGPGVSRIVLAEGRLAKES